MTPYLLVAAAALAWGEGPAAGMADAAPPTCLCVCPPAQPAPPPEAPPAIPASTELAAPPLAEAKPAGSVEPPRTWYGGPAVAADAIALAFMAGGATSNAQGPFWLGVGGFVLGAPINHLAHGQDGRALGSFGIRVLAFGLATGVVLEDLLVNHCDGDVTPCRDPTTTVAIGTVLLLGAMVVDDVLLARTPEPPPRQGISLVPGLAVGPGAGFASLGGRF
jgi:hypothetical protein